MTPDAQADPRTDPGCCAAERGPRIAQHFDERVRRLTVEGPPPMVEVSGELLDLLSDVGEVEPSVLELGCGSGALIVTLLERGARRADGVDLSAESLAVAQTRAEAAGVADRVTFRQADAALLELAQHDWVVLDRVICCYPDVNRLLANSVGAAGVRYAFSLPDSRGWRGLIVRSLFAFEYLVDRIRGESCPAYVHDVRKVDQRLSAAGFRRLRWSRIGLWYAAVYERSPASG